MDASRLAGALLAALATGCPSPAPDAANGRADVGGGHGDAAELDAPEPDPHLAAAHATQLVRLRDAALPALQAFDPVTAHALGRGPLRPPPASRADRASLRDALATAQREAQGLQASELDPEPAMMLHAIEAAMDTIDRDLRGATPLRTDPSRYLQRLAPWLVATRHALASGETADVPASLAAVTVELGEVASLLGAASLAGAEAGARDAEALAAALRDLPRHAAKPSASLSAAATKAAAQADTLADGLRAIAAALPEAEPATWSDRPPPQANPTAVRRLPDDWDRETLRRVLADEEQVHTAADDLLAQLVAILGRLQTMRGTTTVAAGRAHAVTAARCAAAWAPIAAWAGEQTPLAAAALDCDVAARELAGRELDDAELDVALVELGVVRPTRAARRAEVDAALAFTTGTAAPTGQGLALTVSVLQGAGRRDAALRTLERARDAACLAATALVVHGLGDADHLDDRIGSSCGHREAEAWIADARAHPRAALDGLGLLLLGSSPADAVAMNEFWWAPMGLVHPLAQPPATRASPAPAPKVEPL